MKRLAIIVFNLSLLAAVGVAASVESVQFETAQQRSLYSNLLTELRCLVCANQSLADSNADLAKDLRSKVQNMVARGQSRQEIIDYMVKRYGEYILYRPLFSRATLFLWISPFLLVVFSCVFAVILIMKKSRQTHPYSTKQLQKAKQLLEDESN